ncbi:MAG: hypothetical protein ACE5JA_11205, partial [bacterium]
IISQVSLTNLLIDPDKYKEYAHPGKSAYPEYVALLCLKRPFNMGRKLLIDGDDLDLIQTTLEEIFQATIQLEVSRSPSFDREEPPTDLEELQFLVRLNEIFVRYPAYPRHLYEVIIGLFEPFGDLLLSEIGFPPENAVRLSQATAELVSERLLGRTASAKALKKDVLNLVREYRRNRTFTPNDGGGIPKRFVKELASLPDRKLRALLRSQSIAWDLLGLGQTCSYSAQELSDFTTIPEERVRAFLELLAIDFGDVDADFYVPDPVHILKQQPFLVHSGRYLCPAPTLLDWAMQPALERVINRAGKKFWQQYIKHRHEYVLNESVRLMKSVMPEATFGTNLEYHPDDSSKGEVCELDALGIFDSVLFLVEAKGGGVAEQVRRASPQRLQWRLKELLGEAHEQGLRAKSYIQSTEAPVFKEGKGRGLLKLEKTGIRETFLISVFLEPFDDILARMNAKRNLDVFGEGNLPWMVSMYDLMVITDLIDYAPMFPHYVKQRIGVAEQGFLEAHDELDFFGCYLKEGLYFEPEQDAGPVPDVHLTTYTTDLDDYYFYAAGVRRRPAAKPTRHLPDGLRQILRDVG